MKMLLMSVSTSAFVASLTLSGRLAYQNDLSKALALLAAGVFFGFMATVFVMMLQQEEIIEKIEEISKKK